MKAGLRALWALWFMLGAASAADTRIVTDSAGRNIAVPAHIERIFAAGTPAAITLYTLAPDKLLGWPMPVSEAEKAFMPAPYRDLPVLGRLTGRANTANVETVLAAHPDIIIDVGSVDPTHVSLADRIAAQTGIPYLIYDGTLGNSVKLYTLLGALLGEEAKAAELAHYAEKTLAAIVPEASGLRPRVYYARGPDGSSTAMEGSLNGEFLHFVGAVNVASAEGITGLATISPEQILAWDPEVVVTLDANFFRTIQNLPAWQPVKAVREHRVYLSPSLPFGWIDTPPAVNRLLGVRWLTQI